MKTAAVGTTVTTIDKDRRNNRKGQATIIARDVKRGVDAGLLTVGLNYVLFPSEVRKNVKTTLCGQDMFVSKTVRKAGKAAKKAGEAINKEEVAEKAKGLFAETVKKASPAIETLSKAFVGVTSAVFVGNLVSDAIIEKHLDKQ